MNIRIASGVGIGSTKLSAFDQALKQAGMYNFNIIYLSSVIPPKSKILTGKKPRFSKSDVGKRLYAVLAEIRSDKKGNYIGAGLGWYQFSDGSGVFVEHIAETKSYEATQNILKKDIAFSIKDLCKFRGKKYQKTKLHYLISISEVKTKPVSVVVLAKYKVEGWE